jgi:DNA-binding MarR family transcriptional regulator
MNAVNRNRKAESRRERETGEIVRFIRRIRIAHRRYSAELARKHRMTAQQVGALAIIARRPGISLGELGERMYLHVSTCSGIIDRLERKGYVERRRLREDRRVVHLHATPSGRRTIARMPVSGFGALMRDIQKLPAREIHDIRDAMRILVRVMKLDSVEKKEVRHER